ncbi:MAG: ECF transporter S component [Bacillota bacterium]|nr:ECF transporter S component [Bacillota bacterium]
MKLAVRKLTFSALLTALAIIIPVVFGPFLRVTFPPFTATLGAHVPMFLAMLVGPEAAVAVGVGSLIGFMLTSTSVVAARAFMHTFVGLVGALLIKRGVSIKKVVVITAPIHAVLEALVVIPFGYKMYQSLVLVGVGTIIHHFIDAVIAFALAAAIERALRIKLVKMFEA